MSAQHPTLTEGRWRQLAFVEQMANVASEVERALNWRAKNNEVYSRRAFERAEELLGLTVAHASTFPQRREVARVREALLDYFYGINQSGSTDVSWRKYFLAFVYAARRNR